MVTPGRFPVSAAAVQLGVSLAAVHMLTLITGDLVHAAGSGTAVAFSQPLLTLESLRTHGPLIHHRCARVDRLYQQVFPDRDANDAQVEPARAIAATDAGRWLACHRVQQLVELSRVAYEHARLAALSESGMGEDSDGAQLVCSRVLDPDVLYVAATRAAAVLASRDRQRLAALGGFPAGWWAVDASTALSQDPQRRAGAAPIAAVLECLTGVRPATRWYHGPDGRTVQEGLSTRFVVWGTLPVSHDGPEPSDPPAVAVQWRLEVPLAVEPYGCALYPTGVGVLNMAPEGVGGAVLTYVGAGLGEVAVQALGTLMAVDEARKLCGSPVRRAVAPPRHW